MPDWPHAPLHRLGQTGAYMVTAGTYGKAHHLHSPHRLDIMLDSLLTIASEFGWRLQAWAVMSNHYHFMAISPDDPESLRVFLSKLHSNVSRELNKMDNTPERRVWYQFYETHITYERSYFSRLRYVNQNPVHHGLIDNACNYRWCSAAWFQHNTSAAFSKTIASFKTDRLRVIDPFEPEPPAE